MEEIFKKSFLEGFTNVDISAKSVWMSFLLTGLISAFIFIVYRFSTRKTFYSKDFNISLICVALITSAIIVTIQSSVVVSLGMVGALSIVRFRTAIKNPMDLAFLFWSISVGIICGAGLAMYAIMLSIIVGAVIMTLNNIPNVKAPMILVVNCSSQDIECILCDSIKEYSKYYCIKSRNISSSGMDFTVELKTDKGGELVKRLMEIEGVECANLLRYDGESVF